MSKTIWQTINWPRAVLCGVISVPVLLLNYICFNMTFGPYLANHYPDILFMATRRHNYLAYTPYGMTAAFVIGFGVALLFGMTRQKGLKAGVVLGLVLLLQPLAEILTNYTTQAFSWSGLLFPTAILGSQLFITAILAGLFYTPKE